MRNLEKKKYLQPMLDALRRQERTRHGRNPEPPTVAADSQSVKTTEKGGSAA